jgi:hypothetical protein
VVVSLILLLQQPQPGLATGVVAAVNRFTDFLLQYAIALAAVGALAMTLIEFWKKMFDSRTKFQARRWTQWTSGSAFDPNLIKIPKEPVAGAEDAPGPSRESALSELLQLCTGVPRDDATTAAQRLFESSGELPWLHAYSQPAAHALFALDLGRMMGSIQEAADVALASPTQNPSLYLLMTMGAKPEDISGWYADGASSMVEIAETTPTAEQRRRIKDQADRFARLRQIVKRKLDGFQLYTGDRWASRNQFAANLVGIALMFSVLMWMSFKAIGPSLGFGYVVVLSLLGGVLSPVAKDLVSALKRVKDG